MKYRLKIVTFNSGRKEYYPYVRKHGLWYGLGYDGDASLTFVATCKKREYALEIIDNHFAGNTTVQKIDFEYINK